MVRFNEDIIFNDPTYHFFEDELPTLWYKSEDQIAFIEDARTDYKFFDIQLSKQLDGINDDLIYTIIYTNFRRSELRHILRSKHNIIVNNDIIIIEAVYLLVFGETLFHD